MKLLHVKAFWVVGPYDPPTVVADLEICALLSHELDLSCDNL